MIRRLIVLTLIQFSILLSQTQIAVVDFEALGVSNEDARALTNRLMVEMHRTNKFMVLEREMLDKIIEEQKFQLSGCNSDVCLVELGQIANVQQIVGGTISKVGDIYTITARLISVETGEVVESALFDHSGNISQLMKSGMENIATQLASNPLPSIVNSNNSLHETVADIDGNVYGTIKIGSQVWMTENLKVTHYRDGQPIPTGHDENAWRTLSYGAYSGCFGAEGDATVYGYLYNWFAVSDLRNLAPDGWHIPTDDEWTQLEIALGMQSSESNKSGWRGEDEGSMIAGFTDLWDNGALKFKPEFGVSKFNAVPSGCRGLNGKYFNEGYYGLTKMDIFLRAMAPDAGNYKSKGSFSVFWTKSSVANQVAWYRLIDCYNSGISKEYNNKRFGFSVRCVKD